MAGQLGREDGLDEAPPPYTPYADGATEQTSEYGPSRPFAEDAVRVNPLGPMQQQQQAPWQAQAQMGGQALRYPLAQPPRHPMALPLPSPQPPRHPSAQPSPQQQPASPGYPVVPSADRPTVGLYGKTLIYPPNFVCPKCSNTGFKYSNSARPCMKCWETYGKKNPGAAIHAPGVTFQRPVQPRPTINAAVAVQSGPPLGRYGFPVPTTPGAPFGGMAYGPGYSGYGPPQPMGQYPQGGITVAPGDPRIGGQLCLSCGGSGIVDAGFLMGDVTCTRCRGVGRVF